MGISLKPSAAILAWTIVLAPAAQASESPEVAVVHQIISFNMATSAQAFRSGSKFLQSPAEATVRFKRSTGRHAVTAIPRVIPIGAPVFEIRGKPELNLTLEREAVYEVRCRVYGRHGMVMLLVLGDPGSNLEEANADTPNLGEAERAGIEDLFANLETQNG